MKTTDELRNEIRSATDLVDYFEKNSREMQVDSLPEYLEQWLNEKNTTKAEVVRRSNLNRAYVYQIFLGKKYPSRDKVIALAFGLGLNESEVQTLLKQAGYRELYPRDTRDAALLFSFSRGESILDANERLYDLNIDVLE